MEVVLPVTTIIDTSIVPTLLTSSNLGEQLGINVITDAPSIDEISDWDYYANPQANHHTIFEMIKTSIARREK